MKNILTTGALAAIALLAIGTIGCGDDPVAVDINTHFEPKQGDTFTYVRYNRDMNNQRIDSTKSIHKWVVLDAGGTHEGEGSVARILQLNFAADGVTSTGANDTLYISSGTDGEIWMDVIGAAMRRIPAAADLAAQIPFIWVKVSDTKTSNAIKFQAASEIVDVNLLGVDLRITFRDTAYHKGKVAATIGGTNYPGAFHTDHTLAVLATPKGLPAPIIISDSLHMSYDFDVQNGLLRQVMMSDTITLGPPLSRNEAVQGFEFEFVSAVRK